MVSFPKGTCCGLQDYHATAKGPKEIHPAASRSPGFKRVDDLTSSQHVKRPRAGDKPQRPGRMYWHNGSHAAHVHEPMREGAQALRRKSNRRKQRIAATKHFPTGD